MEGASDGGSEQQGTSHQSAEPSQQIAASLEDVVVIGGEGEVDGPPAELRNGEGAATGTGQVHKTFSVNLTLNLTFSVNFSESDSKIVSMYLQPGPPMGETGSPPTATEDGQSEVQAAEPLPSHEQLSESQSAEPLLSHEQLSESQSSFVSEVGTIESSSFAVMHQSCMLVSIFFGCSTDAPFCHA